MVYSAKLQEFHKETAPMTARAGIGQLMAPAEPFMAETDKSWGKIAKSAIDFWQVKISGSKN
jgi:hypothetical protein